MRMVKPAGGPVSPQDFQDLQAGANGFESLAAYWYTPGGSVINLTGGGEPRQVQAAYVSREFFPLLGANAPRGRTLHPQENVPGAAEPRHGECRGAGHAAARAGGGGVQRRGAAVHRDHRG